jgi:hypothetical protein
MMNLQRYASHFNVEPCLWEVKSTEQERVRNAPVTEEDQGDTVHKLVKRKTGYQTVRRRTTKMGCTVEGLMEVDGEKGQMYMEEGETMKGSEPRE